MDFKELQDMLNKEYNDPNSKFYNNIHKMWLSYSRKKKLRSEFINNTSFIDEIFIPNKELPEPPFGLRMYCIMNGIDSVDKYPKCPVCGKPKSFAGVTEGFNLSCGDRNCYQKLDEVNKKRQSTAKENYGSLKSAYHERMQNTVREKYGVDNVANLDWVKKKKVQTAINNWKDSHSSED